MSIWDTDEYKTSGRVRRDTSKFGIVRSPVEGFSGRMYIPKGKAVPGDKVRFIETPQGMAFRISREGEFTVYAQNGGSRIMMCRMPPAMNRYAPDKAISVDVEPLDGGYLIPYRQFEK